MNDKLVLSEMQLDVVREIGNIGAGHAATALAEMLDIRIDKNPPAACFMNIGEVIARLGGPERVAVAILDKLSGDLEGIMMFVIDRAFIRRVLERLGLPDAEEFGEMGLSAIGEVGNIMVASYAGAVAQLTGLSFNLSVPAVTVDMVGAIMNVPATALQSVSDDILMIEDNFMNPGGDASVGGACTLYVPSRDSLGRLLESLGFGHE